MLITDPTSAVARRRREPTRRRSGSSTTASAATRSSSTGSARTSASTTGDTIITAGSPAGGKLPSLFPRNIPIGYVSSVGQSDTDIFKDIQVQPFVDLSSARVGARADPEAAGGGQGGRDRRRAQGGRRCCSSRCSSRSRSPRAYSPLGGSADVVLVVLIAIALLRGSIFGALAGFGDRAAARHREPRRCSASPRCC